MKRSLHAKKWYETERGKLYRFYTKLGSYGLNEEQFKKLLEDQDNRCAICQVVFTEKSPPRIDHDHLCCPRNTLSSRSRSICGRCVRGLLCNRCNVGLGMLDDNIERLVSAINYLQLYEPKDYLAKEESLEASSNLVYSIGGVI